MMRLSSLEMHRLRILSRFVVGVNRGMKST